MHEGVKINDRNMFGSHFPDKTDAQQMKIIELIAKAFNVYITQTHTYI